MVYRVSRSENGRTWEDLHSTNDYDEAFKAYCKAVNNETFGSTAIVAIWVFPRARGRRPFVIERNG